MIFTFTDSLFLPTFLRVLSVCTVSLSIISRRHWSLSVITDEEVSEYLPSGTSLFSKRFIFSDLKQSSALINPHVGEDRPDSPVVSDPPTPSGAALTPSALIT